MAHKVWFTFIRVESANIVEHLHFSVVEPAGAADVDIVW